MKEMQESKESRVFWLGLICCTVYLSYRYPLQINSAGTSPTYSDTPLMLQLGKFLLVCPLFAIAAVQCYHKIVPRRQWLVALAVLFLSGYSLFKLIGDNNARYLELSFWMLFSLVLAWAVDAVKVSAIDRYLRFLLIYALGSTLIEVVLFAAIDRLPALAFKGTFLVRFGGFLDDPNGFGAILFLLLGWSYGKFKGRARFFIMGSIVVSLLLTQSWTALAFFVVISFIWALLGVFRRPFLAVSIFCLCALLMILIVHVIPQSPSTFFNEVLDAKQGSIEGHSLSWGESFSKWPEWALLGDSTYNSFESWWASAPINFGVPWLLVFLGLSAELIRSLREGLLRAGDEARPIYLGFLLFGSYFMFGSLSLPFPTIFPVNVLFFLFAFLVAFGKIQAG
jgi:hypothetical protein